MGEVILFPARNLSQSEASRVVCKSLTWDVDAPEAERALAVAEATRALHHELNDRFRLLRVVAALACSPLDALAELQRCEPFADYPAGMVDLGLFEAFLFGAASGGLDGPYGRQYFATIAEAGPYVACVH